MKIVVPVMAGIGNAVMTVPMVRRLAAAGDDVVVEAGSAAIADVFQRLDEVTQVLTLPKDAAKRLEVHRSLSGDVYVVPFPSNRWQYTLLAATARCERVVMHSYPCGRWRTGRAMLRRADFVPALRGIHDVHQNLRLTAQVSAPLHWDDAADHAADTPIFRETEGVDTLPGNTIVVQAGCGNTTVGRVKRLPDDTWCSIIAGLQKRGLNVCVVEGPDEQGVGERIASGCSTPPAVWPLLGTLGESAALLKQAMMFIGTDSGLAHVAAAVGRPAVTVFAAADPDRVCPFGCRDLVVTPPPVDGKTWSPRLLYPMDYPAPKLRQDGIDWAKHIRSQDVLAKVDVAMKRSAS